MPSLGLFSFCLFVLFNSEVLVLVLLFHFSLLLSLRSLFSNGRKGGEKQLEEVKGGETIIRMYYARKKIYSQNKLPMKLSANL